MQCACASLCNHSSSQITSGPVHYPLLITSGPVILIHVAAACATALRQGVQPPSSSVLPPHDCQKQVLNLKTSRICLGLDALAAAAQDSVPLVSWVKFKPTSTSNPKMMWPEATPTCSRGCNTIHPITVPALWRHQHLFLQALQLLVLLKGHTPLPCGYSPPMFPRATD